MSSLIFQDIVATVGNTPLIKLNRIAAGLPGNVYVKAEFFNPLASVKDRIGKSMIEAGERDGRVKQGSVIVEATSGNTGIALAFVCAARGYKLILTMPETMSQERRVLLRMLGAEIVLTPGAEGMPGAIRKAEEILAATPNSWMPQQFKNPANPEIHRNTTALEIWDDTDGEVDILVGGVGTGGTLAGVAEALRARNPDVAIGLADPPGAALFSYYTAGELKAEGSSITEGIGQGRITANLEGFEPGYAFRIPDEESVLVCFDLLEHEGLCMGPSSGVNVAGAIRLARELGPGKTIVTILADYGTRYQSKLFNADFLRSKGLPVPWWLDRKAHAEPAFEEVETA